MSNDAVKVDTRELVAFQRKLALVGRATPKNIAKMLKIVGTIVLGKAREYSPMSMSKNQYVSTLVGSTTKRKSSSFTRGSLKSSITAIYKKTSAEILVPTNSKAGEYAEKMHDERGASWKRLSVGKQPKSRDKYIYDAYDDTKKQQAAEVDKFVNKEIFKALGFK